MTPFDFGIVGAVFALSWWLTGRLASPASKLYLLDRPNERSLHFAPTPRTGGIAIVGSLAAGLVLEALTGAFSNRPETLFLAGGLWVVGALFLVAGVSFRDDRMGLPLGARLGFQSLAAAGVVLGGGFVVSAIPVPPAGELSLGLLALPFTILFIVWMTNLYNFMDGMDGFAGGMTVVGCGFLAAVFANGGEVFLTLVSLFAVAAAGGFLTHNFPPAQIFMGDVGSVSLGFLVGALSVAGIHDRVFDVWFPVLVFSPFIVDATVTLFRRLLRGEKVWRAHREHYYQRLVLAGWGHRKTVLAEYVLMTACGASALIFLRLSEAGRLALLSSWALIYVFLAMAVRAIERQARRRALA